MPSYKYETHVIRDPLLPFIFHRCYRHTQHQCPPNWHENIEILFCIEGSGYVKCGIEDTPFCQGDIFIVNADIPHSVGSDETIAYRCLIIDNRFCTDNGIPIGELTFRSTIHDRELADLFETVTAAYDRRDDRDIQATADIRYAVLGLLRMLWCEYAAPKQPRPEADAAIKQALTYIRRNLSGTITLEAISDSVGVSKYHLSRQFKSFTGKTVIDTVNLIRCTEAKRLIEGGMRISAAAAACGYENLSYFTRTFKKLFHALPSSFLPKKTPMG